MLGVNAQISEHLEDLATLNKKLQRLTNLIGTRQDTKQFQNTLDQDRKAAKKLCQDVMNLMQQSATNQSATNRRMVTKLSAQFETQLRKFQEIEKQMSQKRSSLQAAAAGDANAQQADLERGGPFGQDQQQQQQYDSVNITFMEYDLEEVQRRHQGIQQIEQDIQEIGEMFRDLHALVQEQGESLAVIEGSLVGTKEQTKEAHEELLKAETYQKKARKKKCCLIFIGLAVLGAVILIATYAS